MTRSEFAAMVDITLDDGTPVPTLDDYSVALAELRRREHAASANLDWWQRHGYGMGNSQHAPNQLLGMMNAGGMTVAQQLGMQQQSSDLYGQLKRAGLAR